MSECKQCFIMSNGTTKLCYECLEERIKDLEAENKRLNKDYGCVKSLCDSMDEFGEPMKDTHWTNLGERIYEIVVEQASKIKELESDLKIKQSVCKTIIKEVSAINEELKSENKLLKVWQIKPSEAICLTDLACRYKKVFKPDEQVPKG